MANIKNTEEFLMSDLKKELTNGAKFVVFHYSFSVILMTYNYSSDIYFIRVGESTLKHSIGYTLITLFLGWWAIPSGPIFTISALYTNITGGKDVTQEVLSFINSAH